MSETEAYQNPLTHYLSERNKKIRRGGYPAADFLYNLELLFA